MFVASWHGCFEPSARTVAGNPYRVLKKRYKAPASNVCFKRRFTEIDCELLASIDSAHVQLSGPATKHLLHRAFHVFKDDRFELLAGISCSHLYNLRASLAYQGVQVKIDKARLSVSIIGLRAAPRNDGRSGFIRIDSVRQGDLDGVKRVYYINAVDCVTQWEVVACTERISEAFLLPVIEAMLSAFPSRSWAFTPTTAASTSTTPRPGFWRNCASSRPSPAPAKAPTTDWPKSRMQWSSEKPSAVAIFHSASLPPSTRRTCATSTPT